MVAAKIAARTDIAPIEARLITASIEAVSSNAPIGALSQPRAAKSVRNCGHPPKMEP